MLAGGSHKELEIVRDLSRTYPSHVYYQQRQGPGQRSLFNVLRAYSIYDRQARSPCHEQWHDNDVSMTPLMEAGPSASRPSNTFAGAFRIG